jgi:AbrB family looped-hinge helix DNA binding protein
MNLAKVSANGQITVPAEVRNALRLKKGDKVLFLTRDNGEITIRNASEQALYEVQKAFSGVAEKMGRPSEDDIQSWVDEVRYAEGK